MGDQIEHEDLGAGDLLAYLEGEAGPALAAHVAGCPRCQAELAELRAADSLLGAAIARLDCPAPELLLRHVAGLLGPDEDAVLASHLAGCVECRADLALLADPPAPSPLGRLARAGARLIRAALQPAPALAPALRGSSARRLVYAVDDYQLLVAVIGPDSPGGPAQIEGQLLGAEADLAPAGGTARLLRAGGEMLSGPLDELGFFAFDDVPPGSYALALGLGDAEILVEEISV